MYFYSTYVALSISNTHSRLLAWGRNHSNSCQSSRISRLGLGQKHCTSSGYGTVGHCLWLNPQTSYHWKKSLCEWHITHPFVLLSLKYSVMPASLLQ